MLRARVLTALVLIPLFVWGIVAMSTFQFALLLTLIIGAAAWEWAGLANGVTTPGRLAYAVGLCAVAWGLKIGGEPAVLGALLAAGLWWFSAPLWLWRYVAGQRGGHPPRPEMERRRAGVFAAGALTLIPAWLAVVALRGQSGALGQELVLFLMVLVWSADIGAYFAGRAWGRHRLAPHISPGKSWEGVAGGLVLAGVVAAGGGYWLGFAGLSPAAFLLACFLAAVFSILGDLMESMYKRRAQVKDSGHLLPGHGGVLDRIDSLTAAAPLFAASLLLLWSFVP